MCNKEKYATYCKEGVRDNPMRRDYDPEYYELDPDLLLCMPHFLVPMIPKMRVCKGCGVIKEKIEKCKYCGGV